MSGSVIQGRCAVLALALLFTPFVQVSAVPWFMSTGSSNLPHPKGCAQGWVWVSAEEWWRRELLPPGGFTNQSKDHGHQHAEMCWPQQLLLPGEPRPFRSTAAPPRDRIAAEGTGFTPTRVEGSSDDDD